VSDPNVIREWNADEFHRRVLELEGHAYIARRESYRITPEMSPETGEIIHLHAIELLERDHFRCQYCGLDGMASFENALVMGVDFVVPGHAKARRILTT